MATEGGGEVVQSARQRARKAGSGGCGASDEVAGGAGGSAERSCGECGDRDRGAGRAEQEAAEAVGVLLGEQVTLAEIGERCGLAVKEVARLKRIHLDGDGQGQADKSRRDGSTSGGDQRS